jgi:amino acid transporter
MHPTYQTPVVATVAMGVASIVFYVGLVIISGDVLGDSIAALGLLIAFYYALTGFACVWHFRKQLTTSVQQLLVKGLLPFAGAAILTACFFKSAHDMYASDYGNTSFQGVGGVFLLGIGSLVLGIVLMLAYESVDKTFFSSRDGDVTPLPVPRQASETADPLMPR